MLVAPLSYCEVSSSSHSRQTLLVSWSGADWHIASPLLDAGSLPQLAKLVQRGVAGKLNGTPPHESAIAWTTVATGKSPHRHGISGYASADPLTKEVRPTLSTDRRSKAIWEILSAQGKITHLVNWPVSYPAENAGGVCISDAWIKSPSAAASWSPPRHTVHPVEATAELEAMRVSVDELDPQILGLFIPRFREIAGREPRVGKLAAHLCELYSTHNAAVHAAQSGNWDFLTVHYRFIKQVCLDFIEFHPPRRAHISEHEFAWYHEVVTSAYRLQDVLLADLLGHARPDVTAIVCSEHGFHSDEHRPAFSPHDKRSHRAAWYRPLALFCMAGPGIARDQLAVGATLADIAPTLLHLHGLPVGKDMDGRVLTDTLNPPAPIRFIESWETATSERSASRHVPTLEPEEASARLSQIFNSGCLEVSPTAFESIGEAVERERRWNLAVSLRYSGHLETAWEHLEWLHFLRPENTRYAAQLAFAQLRLGLIDEAQDATRTLVDYLPAKASLTIFLQAEIALARGDAPLAREIAHDAAYTSRPELRLIRGRALLYLQRWQEASEILKEVLEANPDESLAWLGLACAYLRTRQYQEAERCAREALGIDPSLVLAVHTLAEAQAATGRDTEAMASWQRALTIDPGFAPAHLALRAARGKPLQFSSPEKSPEQQLSERRQRRAQWLKTWHHDRQHLRAHSKPVALFQPATQRLIADEGVSAAAKFTFIIVTGQWLPGSTLVMQLLERGGLRPAIAGAASSPDNFLWARGHELSANPELIVETLGLAVSLLPSQLLHLSPAHHYKIIYVRRATDSQSPSMSLDDDLALTLLQNAPNVESLVMVHEQLVQHPLTEITRIESFLGKETLPDAAKLSATISSLIPSASTHVPHDPPALA